MTRARKLERYLSQPFFVAEQFTGTPGVYVPVAETVRGFKEILREARRPPRACVLHEGHDRRRAPGQPGELRWPTARSPSKCSPRRVRSSTARWRWSRHAPRSVRSASSAGTHRCWPPSSPPSCGCTGPRPRWSGSRRRRAISRWAATTRSCCCSRRPIPSETSTRTDSGNVCRQPSTRSSRPERTPSGAGSPSVKAAGGAGPEPRRVAGRSRPLPTSAGQPNSMALYSESLCSGWRASMSRTVPDFERMTSDWASAPTSS